MRCRVADPDTCYSSSHLLLSPALLNRPLPYTISSLPPTQDLCSVMVSSFKGSLSGNHWKTAQGGQLQEAQAISVLHEMLQQSFNLFHTVHSSAAWDTTLLEQLRTGLHQQLDDLDACLGQVMGEEDSALGRMGPTLAVKRYFQGIHVYLQEKEYSACAWEIVRLEIMRSFSSSTSLQERLSVMDGDQNSP
ncbi:interferon omega-1-like [Cervus elaphus]|uniref:interferon omega-1-like n=1 Tax=Cervus elaphus TaxID=9860 RepID=UPI001CC2B0BC|nr:interferon omega-1-like [Cervus elaphus]